MANVSNNPFQSLVGLRGVDTAAKSWVNDIPGVSTELVADLAQPSDLLGSTDQQPDGRVEIWNGVHREAYERLLTEIGLILAENYDFVPFINRLNDPLLAKPRATLSGGFLVGSIASIPYMPNTDILLNSMSVWITPNGQPNPQPVQATVRVYDMDSEAMFYSAPHEFSFGMNTIQINEKFRTVSLEGLRLGVFVNAPFMLTELVQSWSECNPDYKIEGVRTASTVFGPTTPEKTYVALDINVNRSIESLMPRYASSLQNAYRYLCGSLLMTEKLATPNLSVFTLSNSQLTERMETKLFDDFKRALRPTVRLISNELQKQQALAVPVATPSEITYVYGSYV